jgi:hypothetical protein
MRNDGKIEFTGKTIEYYVRSTANAELKALTYTNILQ